MKLPFPRRFKACLVAVASLTAVAGVLVAPMTRPLAQSPATYTFTDLGALGGTYSRALGINNCGQIVGEASVTGVSPTRPFIWRDLNGNLLSDPGEMKDLGTLGGNRGLATDINASGLVVGTSTIANGEERAFRWFDLDGDGIPDPGEMIDLGVLPNHSTHGASGVNDNGQIVGSAESGDGVASGFIWNASTGLQLLQTLNGIRPSHGYSINNSSHIAGYSSDLDHALVFNGTTNIDLQTFGGPRSIAYDINATGHAVGFADVDNSSGSPPSHAFKWNGIALQDLGVLTGGVRSQAFSVNSGGIVVGYSEVTGSSAHAFVHHGTQMYDLNAIVTNLPTGFTLTHARGINDGGQIVGQGTTSGGEIHAFLLTPTGFTPSCSPTVTVSVSPAAVSEDGATNLTYTFTRAPVTNTPVTVNFSTTGSADSSDYGISSVGSVTIPANQQSATVTVDPAPDFAVETNETVVLTTTAGSYIIGSPTSATGTINNDDSIPSVTVAVLPSTAAEDGADNLAYTFTRSSTAGALTVNFSVGGTADSFDYAQAGAASFTPPTGAVSFADGISIATVTINPTTDSTIEPDETVILTLTADANYTIGSPGAATGTITNDDSIPSVSVAVSPLATAEDGANNLVYTFTRSTTTGSDLVVKFAVTGTAGSGDYAISSVGTVTIPAGLPSATVTVDSTVDTLDEPDETVILTISADAAYTIAAPPQHAASGTITDDDGIPTIQITNVTAPEPELGFESIFVFTVSLTNPSSSQVTVNYAAEETGAPTSAVRGSGCALGIDFTNSSGTLTFQPNETSKQVSVTVCSDDNLESDEPFFVNLSGNSANSSLPAGTKGTGTITPQAPVVYVEAGTENNPIPTAAVIDSVTFARGPFRLINNHNFSNEQPPSTRIIIFTSRLHGMERLFLASGILSVHIAGYGQIPLANIEDVGPVTGVPGLSASYIIVKLPADLPNPLPGPNNLTLTVKMGSATSNATLLSITP